MIFAAFLLAAMMSQHELGHNHLAPQEIGAAGVEVFDDGLGGYSRNAHLPAFPFSANGVGFVWVNSSGKSNKLIDDIASPAEAEFEFMSASVWPAAYHNAAIAVYHTAPEMLVVGDKIGSFRCVGFSWNDAIHGKIIANGIGRYGQSALQAAVRIDITYRIFCSYKLPEQLDVFYVFFFKNENNGLAMLSLANTSVCHEKPSPIASIVINHGECAIVNSHSVTRLTARSYFGAICFNPSPDAGSRNSCFLDNISYRFAGIVKRNYLGSCILRNLTRPWHTNAPSFTDGSYYAGLTKKDKG